MDFQRIVLDIADGPTDFIRVAEEHLPSRPAPDGMARGAKRTFAKPRAADGLQIGDHLFCFVFVFANDEVNVVGHDGGGVAGVAVRGDGFC